MRKLLTILTVLWAGAAMAAVINSQGTSGAPKAVSNSAVKVLAGNIHRTAWCIEPETVSIRCTVGGVDDAAPATTPTSTVGYLIPSATMFCVNSGFNANKQAPIDPQQRLDCISTGSSTSVDTFESY